MLEVIAINYLDCIKIESSLATRIELCEEMDLGGMTPSIENIKKCLEVVTIPIRVMIRVSQNYTTSEEDIELMISQIKERNHLNIEGYVIGCNDEDIINEKHLKRLRDAAGSKNLIYHRAFDHIKNRTGGIEILKKHGVCAILTTGSTQSITSNTSISNYKEMKECGVEVVAGGGVNFENIECISKLASSVHVGSVCRVNSSFEEDIEIEKINKLYALLDKRLKN